MPEISRFFGMRIFMYYDDHDPPHIHVRYQGQQAKLDFSGNLIAGSLSSPSRVRLIRFWLELHAVDLQRNWEHACQNKPLEKIPPLK